jgi:hypothetical protein
LESRSGFVRFPTNGMSDCDGLSELHCLELEIENILPIEFLFILVVLPKYFLRTQIMEIVNSRKTLSAEC